MSMLEVSGLTKSYPARHRLFRKPTATTVVSDFSFSMELGETIAIIGESGAGKSTVARLINRLIEPDAGSIRFLGDDLMAKRSRSLNRFRANMQMVFQDPFSCFDPRLTIGESVCEPLLLHADMTREQRRERAAELLDRVGLETGYLSVKPRTLSGGQLQRVAIARALSVNPKLIICDEPVSALDVSVRAQVLKLMRDLRQDFGVTYLIITHDLSIVPVIADRVLVMRGGQLVEDLPAVGLYDLAKNDYTRELINALPSLVPKALRTHSVVSPRLDEVTS